MQRVVCFGEILFDKLDSIKLPGGAPMNVALHLKKHGIESVVVSSVGNDDDGKQLVEFLSSQGLSTHFIQTHPTLATGVVEVSLDENKQATYNIIKPVAWDEISWQDNLATLIERSDALVFGSLASRSRESYNTLLKLLEHCSLSVFDMNLRAPHFEKDVIETLIQKCHILKINEHELDYLKELYHLEGDINGQLKKLSALTRVRTICLTLGDEGAMIVHDMNIYRHSGFKINVADTIGAGDAFLASFLSGYLQKEKPMNEILSRACATGALIASKPGATHYYEVAEIDKIITFNFTKE